MVAGSAPYGRGLLGAAALLVAGIVAIPAATPTGTGQGARAAVSAADSTATARNVILLIGDGMGDSEITLARNYTVGAGGRLHMDRFPMTGTYTTYSVDTDGEPNYVTDSAASATAWATGHKTLNDRISKTPDTDRAVPTILELAQHGGLATGSVTTAELTDATPAAIAAHVTDRSCQGPADMALCPADARAEGGPGSIAEQTVAHQIDVLLGGGKRRFDQTITEGPERGATVLHRARQRGYQVVTNARGLDAARPGQPVLGLFAPEAVPVEWTGRPAAAGGTAPQRCVTANPERSGRTPSLEAQTRKAIGLLEVGARQKGQGKGFFLQVEGASIDKQNHDADPCGQIGETAAFDRAVKTAREYATQHPDTLVITTADHGHSSQIVPMAARPAGLSATLVTDEGALMKVSYATHAGEEGQEHSGVQVRIAAEGPQAHRVLGATDQTELFTTLRTALDLH
ncbi:alkaline phosphatase [Streptomyces sp. NPDC015125]|uniref:alkaline phosphatase n=1 Tax=Streptomyces sp. NPDC015125 TaxID=3364938 RepID=UPI0037006C09